MNFVKTTIIGGLVFLVPVVALVLIFAKLFSVMLTVADPMAGFFPVDSVAGIALANVIAVLIILLICFVAGLVARAGPAQKLADAVENAILQKIPGYSLAKGLAGSLTPDKTAHMRPVLVSLGYSSRVGLQVERIGDDQATVYFPGSPNAWSGEVHVVNSDRITPIDRPISWVIEFSEQLGTGSNDILRAPPQD